MLLSILTSLFQLNSQTFQQFCISEVYFSYRHDDNTIFLLCSCYTYVHAYTYMDTYMDTCTKEFALSTPHSARKTNFGRSVERLFFPAQTPIS